MSSPVLVAQSRAPPKAAFRPMFGRGGRTGGPYIFRESRPPTASAWSRTVSAPIRKRGPCASSRLSGSRSETSGMTFDDWRYAADVTSSFRNFFTSHFSLTSSIASQSSSSGCEGASP